MNVREASRDPIQAQETPHGLIIHEGELASQSFIVSDTIHDVKP